MQTTIEIDSRLIRDDYEIIAFRQAKSIEIFKSAPVVGCDQVCQESARASLLQLASTDLVRV